MLVDPNDHIISRKRKKYRFALFANSPRCYEIDAWEPTPSIDVIEMGAGTAVFSCDLAQRNPEVSFLAVDVKADRLQKGALHAESEALTNISFLRARADQLDQALSAASLQSIWITFPDPFPKDRAAKHRLTHPKYLAMYSQLLRSGGSLYFKTDSTTLFQWSLEQLVGEGWTVEELTFDLHESSLSQEYKIMTTYESRFTKQQLPIGFVRATPPTHR